MNSNEKNDVAFRLSQMRKWLSGEPADVDCEQFIIALGMAETIINAIPPEPKPMIPQVRTFRERFEEMHKEPPRYIICNLKTFREMEFEAGVGYIPTPANKCPTVCGMPFVVPEDGEVIIGNGYVEKYKFEGGAK